MNRRHFLTGAAATGIAGCGGIPSESFSYRLKVVLDDNGTERSGSSVIKVVWHNHSGQPMRYSGNYESGVWGEAPIIDMGARGPLFALLSGSLYDTTPRFSAYFTPMGRLCSEKGYWNPKMPYDFKPDFWGAVKAVRTKTGEHDLWDNQLPQLACFKDLAKPASIVEVSPEHVSETYSGVVLRRVSIELTDAPPTERILNVLPWLHSTEFFTANRQVGPTSSFADRTRRGHFRRWGT